MNKKASAILIILFLAASLVSAGAGLLDGKTFEGMTGEKGKTEGQKDSLIFADGKFRSSGCDEYGFKPVEYKATNQGDSVTFEAAATSEKEGSIHWTGTVTGSQAEAHFAWHKAGQKDIEYWFKGTLKK